MGLVSADVKTVRWLAPRVEPFVTLSSVTLTLSFVLIASVQQRLICSTLAPGFVPERENEVPAVLSWIEAPVGITVPVGPWIVILPLFPSEAPTVNVRGRETCAP